MNTKIPPRSEQNSATDLSTFLLSLPAAARPRRGLDKDMLQIHLPKDSMVQVRLLVEAVRLLATENNTDDASPDSFRADSLVAHLLREFLTTHQPAIAALEELVISARQQKQNRQVAKLEQLMVVNNLLAP